MQPLPRMATQLGTHWSLREPSEVKTVVPSMEMPGGAKGTEPGARIMCLAVTSSLAPALCTLARAGVDAGLGHDVDAEGGQGVGEVPLRVVGELLGVRGDRRAAVLHVIGGEAEALSFSLKFADASNCNEEAHPKDKSTSWSTIDMIILALLVFRRTSSTVDVPGWP